MDLSLGAGSGGRGGGNDRGRGGEPPPNRGGRLRQAPGRGSPGKVSLPHLLPPHPPPLLLPLPHPEVLILLLFLILLFFLLTPPSLPTAASLPAAYGVPYGVSAASSSSSSSSFSSSSSSPLLFFSPLRERHLLRPSAAVSPSSVGDIAALVATVSRLAAELEELRMTLERVTSENALLRSALSLDQLATLKSERQSKKPRLETDSGTGESETVGEDPM